MYQMWKKSTHLFLRYCHKYNNYEKLYSTCVGNTLYMITWQNMNKVHPFFSAIPQQIQKMYEKSGHNYSNLVQSQMRIDKRVQRMVPSQCTKYEQNHHCDILFCDITTNTQSLWKQIAIITQIWHRDKFCFTYINGPWYLIIPNMKNIYLAITEAHGRTNGRTDWWTETFPTCTFLNST